MLSHIVHKPICRNNNWRVLTMFYKCVDNEYIILCYVHTAAKLFRSPALWNSAMKHERNLLLQFFF